MENADHGKYRPWKMQTMENADHGKDKPWKM